MSDESRVADLESQVVALKTKVELLERFAKELSDYLDAIGTRNSVPSGMVIKSRPPRLARHGDPT